MSKAALTVAEIRSEVERALRHAHERAEFWLEEREALQEMAVPLGVPWPQDEEEPAQHFNGLGYSTEAEQQTARRPATEAEPFEEAQARMLAALDKHGGEAQQNELLATAHISPKRFWPIIDRMEQEDTVIVFGRGSRRVVVRRTESTPPTQSARAAGYACISVTAAERRQMILDAMRAEPPGTVFNSITLRDSLNMASSDFSNSMGELRRADPPLVEDLGVEPAGMHFGKRWKLADGSPADDGYEGPRRGDGKVKESPLAREMRGAVLGDLRQVEKNGIGTPQGRVLALLQSGTKLSASEIAERLEMHGRWVREALRNLMAEDEVEDCGGDMYRAVPLPRNVSSLNAGGTA